MDWTPVQKRYIITVVKKPNKEVEKDEEINFNDKSTDIPAIFCYKGIIN